MPRIDELASRGILFEKAYAAAPVCAPSRSGIITGIMPTTLGSTPMRCTSTPPAFLVGFPRFLRSEGFFCTNNRKTDYNLPESFDAGWNLSNAKAHWRERPDRGRPFFAVFNRMVSHESSLFADAEKRRERTASLPPEARRDPAGVRVPPYYPDTPAVRRELAHRLELAALLDREVGRVLDELAQDGLAGRHAREPDRSRADRARPGGSRRPAMDGGAELPRAARVGPHVSNDRGRRSRPDGRTRGARPQRDRRPPPLRAKPPALAAGGRSSILRRRCRDHAGATMFAAGEPGQLERFAGPLVDDDPAVRFWAACGAGWSGVQAADAATRRAAADMLRAACRDSDPIVAVPAARWILELDADAATSTAAGEE